MRPGYPHRRLNLRRQATVWPLINKNGEKPQPCSPRLTSSTIVSDNNPIAAQV